MLTRALFFLLVTLSIPSTRPSFHPWGAVKPQRRTARPCPDQTMVSSRCRNKDESFEADHSYMGLGPYSHHLIFLITYGHNELECYIAIG